MIEDMVSFLMQEELKMAAMVSFAGLGVREQGDGSGCGRSSAKQVVVDRSKWSVLSRR